MASAASVFGRNDLRGLVREPLLAGIVGAPLGWIAIVRFGVPAAQRLAASRYGVDLAPYHPAILTGFLLLTSPLIVGCLAAFLVLDERDGGTLAVLRVSPKPMSAYLGYRAGTVVLVTPAYVVGTIAASGLLPLRLVPELVPVGLVCGLSGILTGLVLLALARNKVEGLAVTRAVGILLAGLPLIPYFLGDRWQYVFWLLPQYWPAKAFWVLADGGRWWPYAVAGAVYHVPLVLVLYRRFARSLG